MSKDKYDFILNLIENKKLSPSQKERVLRLSILETKKDGVKKDTELFKRIEEIEKKLESERTDGGKISKLKSKKHKPKDTYELLNFFESVRKLYKNNIRPI